MPRAVKSSPSSYDVGEITHNISPWEKSVLDYENFEDIGEEKTRVLSHSLCQRSPPYPSSLCGRGK